MSLRRLRLQTAGESHGPALVAILDGLPAGVPVSQEAVDRELARRQGGYGRGGRMKIEKDRAEFLGGLRAGKTLGSPVATFLRTPAELAAVAAQRPFPDEDLGEAHGVYVGFLKEPLSTERHDLVHGFRTPTDEFAVSGREVWWLCRIRSSESEVSGARLEKALGLSATFRNISTVRALAAKLAG